MEDNFANRFATFYAEHADTYEEDMELAFADFQGFEAMESEYGFLDGVKNVASKVGSTVASGVKSAGTMAKSAGTKLASGAKTALKTTANLTGATSLAKGARNAAIGAGVGAAVNGVQGKSMLKGAAVGAGVGVVGGKVINKGVGMATTGYNKLREKFSDMDYSELTKDEQAIAFANFYSEMEDIYQDNMEDAFNDYVQLHVEMEETYSLKDIANFAKNTRLGRVATGVVGGHIVGQGITSLGDEAKMRRQLKKKLYDGTISKNERVQLERLIDKRNKVKKVSSITGGALGAIV